MPDAAFLTEQQQKWFASVREGLERETGRSLEDWSDIARACPETAHRKRLAWMKAEHGLGQNRASMVLNAAFPPDEGWSKPDGLAEKLWVDPAAKAIHDSIQAKVLALPDVIVGQRKRFTAYSRNFQFCAVRPTKQGVMLGIAVDPSTDLCLKPRGRDTWSERLHAEMELSAPKAVTARIGALLRMAWEAS